MRTFTTSHILKQPHHFDWEGRSREHATGCYLGKIYMVTDGRNAWNDTWISRYRGWDGFTTDLRTAQNKVERMRVQRSTWTITDIPAVVIAGEKAAGYLFGIDSLAPLASHMYDLGPVFTVKTILSRVHQPESKRTLSRARYAGQIHVATLPLRCHKSVTYGGDCRLSWFPGTTDHSISTSRSRQ